jgi:RuvB-like protein 1 (pontin 52)
MIVKTTPYSSEEIAAVVSIRAQVEGLRLGEGVLDKLSEIGTKSSLRYALQLLTPSSILATLAGRQEIMLEDISEMGTLFLDAKSSMNAIKESMEKEGALDW